MGCSGRLQVSQERGIQIFFPAPASWKAGLAWVSLEGYVTRYGLAGRAGRARSSIALLQEAGRKPLLAHLRKVRPPATYMYIHSINSHTYTYAYTYTYTDTYTSIHIHIHIHHMHIHIHIHAYTLQCLDGFFPRFTLRFQLSAVGAGLARAFYLARSLGSGAAGERRG